MERLLCLMQSRAALRETGALPRKSLPRIRTATHWTVRNRVFDCLWKAMLHGVSGPESHTSIMKVRHANCRGTGRRIAGGAHAA